MRGKPTAALIIGMGLAGERFYRALRYAAGEDRSVRIVGVCDLDGDKLAAADPAVPRFADFREAVAECRADVVCVCVNERYHYEVLRHLRAVDSGCHQVLCEKPLTETLPQCSDLRSSYRSEEIAVNFCERFSPIVADFRGWLARQEDFEIVRGEFFWGKCRVNDPRRTIGDFSEITHPLDLVRLLAGYGADVPVALTGVLGSRSDFNPHEPVLTDTLDVQLTMGERLVLVGHSSFMWDERRRRVILYGRSRGGGELHQAVLDFDNPRWDVDRLVVSKFDAANGHRTVAFETNYDNSDFPPELHEIAKVHQFVASGLRVARGERPSELLASLDDAYWVQLIMHKFQDAVNAQASPAVSLKSVRAGSIAVAL